MSTRDDEFVDERGRLHVPVASRISPPPKRPGWKPWWVDVNMDSRVQKVVIYRQEES